MSHLTFAKTAISNLFSRPATRLYPFVKRPAFANTRGRIGIEIRKCIFCSLCAKKCPTDAIAVKKPEKTWEIDRLRCIACGACVDACPKKCLTMENAYSPTVTAKYADTFKLEPAAKAADAAPAA